MDTRELEREGLSEIDLSSPCRHVTAGMRHAVARPATGCEECMRSGDSWVELRICLSCGHVGCCDSSKNKHATAHFRDTRHPIITSGQAGENWSYCYVDGTFLSS